MDRKNFDYLCYRLLLFLCRGRYVFFIFQPDYAGLDYEDGGQDAPLKCDDVMCGNGKFDSGNKNTAREWVSKNV